MPIYEYQCSKCGVFEVTQKITDKPLERCPTCKGKPKKLISNTSFQLKGTGWYVTDYQRKDQGSKPEKPSSTEAKTDGKAESAPKTETKAAAETKAAKTTKTATSDSGA